MNLRSVKDLLKDRKESSLFELANELNADRNEIESTLEILISMNKVEKREREILQKKCPSKGCSGCSCSGSLLASITPEITYCWVG